MGRSHDRRVRMPEETKSAFSLRITENHIKFTVQMKFNPQNRKLLMLSAVETYYASIGIVPNDSRSANQVRARNAIGVALSQWSSNQQEVADILKRDRSTIAHMTINHMDNLEFWKGYKEMYEKAKLIVDSRLSATSKADRLADLTNQIYILEQECAILRNELDTIQVSKDIEVATAKLNELKATA